MGVLFSRLDECVLEFMSVLVSGDLGAPLHATEPPE